MEKNTNVVAMGNNKTEAFLWKYVVLLYIDRRINFFKKINTANQVTTTKIKDLYTGVYKYSTTSSSKLVKRAII